MIIKCLFITRKSEPNNMPELILAWDEYTMEGNPGGFERECRHQLSGWEDEIEAKRIVNIEIEDDIIEGLFTVPVIEATVLPN